MAKYQPIQMKGRFAQGKKGIVYVDAAGKAWNEDALADIIGTFKDFNKILKTMEHYKKFL